MASNAAPGTPKRGSSWNPFRCSGTALAPHVLLAAKLIALFLLAHYVAGHGTWYATRLGGLPPGSAFLMALLRLAAETVAVVCALLLLTNRAARWMSLALGICVGFEFALHRVDFSELLLAVFLFLAAWQPNRREPLLLRYCVVVIYLGVALNWLLGPGSALLFDALAGRARAGGIEHGPTYLALEAALPPGRVPQIADWGLAMISFALATGFLVRRLHPSAIWFALLLHCVWALISGPLPMLAYAMLGFYLVFAPWPLEPLVVIYDGECGFCNLTRQWVSKADCEGIYDWQPFQSGTGAKYGISEKAAEQKVHVVAGDRIYSGFRAFRVMALYNPAVYLAVAVLLVAPGIVAPAIRDWLFLALVLLLSPLFYPVGEAAYDWVARNRYRLPPRTCKAP
jgi:predicted DCC family thiol-disulfide oxidoreductase YuxK